jgi:hypothetical protein
MAVFYLLLRFYSASSLPFTEHPCQGQKVRIWRQKREMYAVGIQKHARWSHKHVYVSEDKGLAVLVLRADVPETARIDRNMALTAFKKPVQAGKRHR